jgi:hypothetical protein
MGWLWGSRGLSAFVRALQHPNTTLLGDPEGIPRGEECVTVSKKIDSETMCLGMSVETGVSDGELDESRSATVGVIAWLL